MVGGGKVPVFAREAGLLRCGFVWHLRGCDHGLTEIRLRKGESLEKALRRLKKRLDREGTIKDARNKLHYEKPSVRRRRKLKVAKFNAMLSQRYAEM